MLDVSLQLIDQNLIAGTGQRALPLWDILQGPINTLGSILHPETPHSFGLIVGVCALLCGFIYQLRILRDENYPHIQLIENIGSILVFCTGLLVISHQWQPQLEDTTSYTWVELQEEKPPEKANLQDIANLVGGDTGEEEEDIAELAKFVDKSSGGTRFPMWLAQSVIPLSFLIMSLRFLALGLSGRFEEDDEDEDDEDDKGN